MLDSSRDEVYLVLARYMQRYMYSITWWEE